LQYACTRTRSLARKAAQSGIRTTDITDLKLGAREEIALAKHLLNFGLVLEGVAEEYRPNFLCNYLYDLAGLLSQFWERCPVLKSDDPERTSRLVLSNLTGSVLRQGLEVLGIKTLEQM
jgi:arginyl-tRNA synthetase